MKITRGPEARGVPRGGVGNRPGANGGLSSPAGWALRSQNNFSAAATSPSPRTADCTAGTPVWPHAQSAQSATVDGLARSEAPAPGRGPATEGRPSFPGCALPELPATGTGRGLFPASVPASLPSSPRRDSLVQTGRGPLLPCPALPRFSPRPAPNSFQHLYGQVQSRSNFFLLLSLSCVRDCG